ncbi:MAG: S1C family serine protease [Luteolibacter sp.]
MPCLSRRWLVLCVSMLCGMWSVEGVRGQSLQTVSGWTVRFLETGETASASPLEEGNLWVAVVPVGQSGELVELRSGLRNMPVVWSAFDPVSRVWIGRAASGALETKACAWSERSSWEEGAPLSHAEGGGKFLGRVKQIGGKVLPFALMRVGFPTDCPPVGSPLFGKEGQVMGLYFQNGTTRNEGYALPAAAVLRVKRDLVASKRLKKGWLGLSLKPENGVPQVTKVEAGSPAEKSGIQALDLLLTVGGRQVNDYADAVDAFFYLSPGVPTRMKFLRGVQEWEVTVTPTER